ncbi:MAG: ThiF family adenylyltransferase [Solobacterium sp.]|nr:ThiF family adenylyltransferase [Solobacterium sp.]
MADYCFYIVGVGGTGSLLARDLPQLLLSVRGQDHSMCLIDGDTVERKNMIRQRFQSHDVGYNKAIALARKINSIYPVECTVIDQYLTDKELLCAIEKDHRIPVIIGCVDNDATRRLLEKTFRQIETGVYIDSANSAYSGNVFSVIKSKGVYYGKTRGQAKQLGTKDKNPAEMSCIERSAAGELQYFITNAKQAVCILEHCFCLITEGEPKITGVTKLDRFAEVHFG